MNRSKVVIGIFVALILIVIAIVLLACTVFVVRDVTVESEVSSGLIDTDEIIESSGLTIGRSIISINKETIKNSIEKQNPYVEVLGIRRIFPNKIVISTTIRTGIMLVSSADNGACALIDSSMKILNIIPASGAYSNVTAVSGIAFEMPAEGAISAVGTKIVFTDPTCGDVLKEIAECAANYEISGKRFFTFFKSIAFDKTDGIKAYIKTNKGVSLVLDKSLPTAVYDQIYYCLFYYSSKDVDIDYTKGYILFDKDVNAYIWKETI